MRTRWMVLAAVAVALTGSPALARGEDSLSSLSSNDYSPKQVETLQRTAARGDTEAMYELAMAYRDGEGAEVDLKKALYWFRKAALKGNVEAMNEVGCAYSRGSGVAIDYVAALGWFRKAADKGDVIAMLNVGVAYDLGQGVTIDDAEAVRWYLRSAEGGDPTAALYLASMYERAEGVRMDFEEAARWYRRAARSEDAEERAQAENGLERVGEGQMPLKPPRGETSLTATRRRPRARSRRPRSDGPFPQRAAR